MDPSLIAQLFGLGAGFLGSKNAGDQAESYNNAALAQNDAIIRLQRLLAMPGIEAQGANREALAPMRKRYIEYLLALTGTPAGKFYSDQYADSEGVQYGGEEFDVPTADQLPDWLKSTELSPSDWTQLTEPAIGGVDAFVRDAESAKRSSYARRGLSSSTASDAIAPGMGALYSQLKAPIQANAIQMKYNMGEANKAKTQGNIGGLMSQLQGMTPNADVSGLAGAMSDQSAMYGNMANNYSNLAGANASNLGQIGQNLSQLINYRRQKSRDRAGNIGTGQASSYSDYYVSPYA